MRMPMLMRIHVSTDGANISFEGFDEPPRGYYQRVGVTAQRPEDLDRFVRQFVSEDTGGRLIEIDDMEVADLEGRHRDIRDLCGDVGVEGIWYASGYAFYSDDDDDEEEDEDEPE